MRPGESEKEFADRVSAAVLEGESQRVVAEALAKSRAIRNKRIAWAVAAATTLIAAIGPNLCELIPNVLGATVCAGLVKVASTVAPAAVVTPAEASDAGSEGLFLPAREDL